MSDAVTKHARGNWLQSRPWVVGLLCALIPFVWLWTLYPLQADSRIAPGRVIATTVRGGDQIVSTAGNGAATVRVYELRIEYQFMAEGASHVGSDTMQIGELNWLKQFRKELLAKNITVVYSGADPAKAFVLEMVSSLHLKLAAALAMTAFLLGAQIYGQHVGVYRDDAWSGPVSEVELRFWMWTALLVLFYGTLIMI